MNTNPTIEACSSHEIRNPRPEARLRWLGIIRHSSFVIRHFKFPLVLPLLLGLAVAFGGWGGAYAST
jgi:hypothetical protein